MEKAFKHMSNPLQKERRRRRAISIFCEGHSLPNDAYDTQALLLRLFLANSLCKLLAFLLHVKKIIPNHFSVHHCIFSIILLFNVNMQLLTRNWSQAGHIQWGSYRWTFVSDKFYPSDFSLYCPHRHWPSRFKNLKYHYFIEN